MTLYRSAHARRAHLRALSLAALLLSCLLLAPNLRAQADNSSSNNETKTPQTTVTVFLNNITDQHDMNEILTSLRNMYPRLRSYGDFSHNSISLQGTAEDLSAAQKLIAELDKPHRAYRLTYTISDTEPGKPAATRHVSLVVLAGNKSVVKQGTRVPIATGASGQDAAPGSTQFQYIDIGLNIDATLESTAQTIQLHTRIEQSSVADEKSTVGTQDPVILQTQLDQTSTLVPGKPLALGSLEQPDSSRCQEVEVVAELIK